MGFWLKVLIYVAAVLIGIQFQIPAKKVAYYIICSVALLVAYELRLFELAKVLMFAAISSFIVVTALLIRAVSLGACFAPDLTKLALFLEVSAEVSPPGIWLIVQLAPMKASDVKISSIELAHSVYNNPLVSVTIADWIQLKEKGAEGKKVVLKQSCEFKEQSTDS